MALDYNQRAHSPAQRAVTRAVAVGDASAGRSAAVLVVAFACAASGLVMGLCLSGVPGQGLSFLFGAVVAGSGVWFMRDVLANWRD